MTVKSNIYIVDLQGFTDFDNNNKFYLKELSILKHESGEKDNECSVTTDLSDLHHYIFEQPFEYRKLSVETRLRALWLKCFHHGFSWNCGVIKYTEISTIIDNILTNDSLPLTIYVKGGHKVVWFNHLTQGKYNCINIEDIGCVIGLRSFECKEELVIKHCHQHNVSLHCTQQNVCIINHWLKKFNN